MILCLKCLNRAWEKEKSRGQIQRTLDGGFCDVRRDNQVSADALSMSVQAAFSLEERNPL